MCTFARNFKSKNIKHTKMKRFILLAFIMVAFNAMSAPTWNMPAMRIQPNGDTLRCLVSGDEIYNRLHDEKNYTIVQNHTNGYWVYATMENGELVATNHVVGTVDPSTLGITPGLMISEKEYQKRLAVWEVPAQYRTKNAHNFGVLNNIVVFIRFQGDSEISYSAHRIENMYNDTTEGSMSLLGFYREMTYNQLDIVTYFYPAPQGDLVVSCEDLHPRNYYIPYDATTNPIGYQTEEDRRLREFDMIQHAVEYINEFYPVDSNLDIDNDNDGEVDNISFVVKGTYTGWSDLLWPHKWNLYDRTVSINGKRVNTFNFILEGAGEHYFGLGTLCHEMFHALSAPDLYHYYTATYLHPTGSWDLMEVTSTPPQHSNAYLKHKYGHWIDSIPEIRVQGTYTLHSVANQANRNNCWKIASSDPNQFYLLEYRNNQDHYEGTIPGTGLLIYRIDTRWDGNAGYDGTRNFDEVYLFRPDGTTTLDGSYNQAHFNPMTGRNEFTATTNPHPFFTDGTNDSLWEIRNICIYGDSLTFEYIDMEGCRMPTNLITHQILGNKATPSWIGFSDGYQIQYRQQGSEDITTDTTSQTSFTMRNLVKATDYEWRVRAICNDTEEEQPYSAWQHFKTNNCYNAEVVNIEQSGNEFQDNVVPFHTGKNYSYTQQIILANEMLGAFEITKLSFNYASGSALTGKGICNIYMGHTSLSSFEDNSDIVPFDSLQLVYTGSLNCGTGWNDFILTTAFNYNGVDNLVIAIDDNSNASSSNRKFYAVSTEDYMTLSYFSTTMNPNPQNNDSFAGSKSRKQYRSMMRFAGCIEGADDPEPESIVQIGNDILGVITHDKQIEVATCCDNQVRLFDILGRLLATSTRGNQHSFTVSQPGVYLIKADNGIAQKVVVK